MEYLQKSWKQTVERLELLEADPRKFVRVWGFLYGVQN